MAESLFSNVTCNLEDTCGGLFKSHVIRVGTYRLCLITDKTPIEAVNKFVQLCTENSAELEVLCKDAEEARDYNLKDLGKGKNWPAFGKLERFKQKLLDQAGVKDS